MYILYWQKNIFQLLHHRITDSRWHTNLKFTLICFLYSKKVTLFIIFYMIWLLLSSSFHRKPSEFQYIYASSPTKENKCPALRRDIILICPELWAGDCRQTESEERTWIVRVLPLDLSYSYKFIAHIPVWI